MVFRCLALLPFFSFATSNLFRGFDNHRADKHDGAYLVGIELAPRLRMDLYAVTKPANSAETAVFAAKLESLATSESISELRNSSEQGTLVRLAAS
jgi:hypothetical protein